MPETITERIFEATLILFTRNGVRRTSMADVARRAGVARATLYLRFGDKRALVEALAEALVSHAMDAAETAWVPGAALAANLEATILAKDLPLYRIIASPHGAELIDPVEEPAQAPVQRLNEAFVALLKHGAEDAAADGADLSAFGGPDGFGSFVALVSAGLKRASASEAEYRAAVHRLCVVAATAAGMPGDPAPTPLTRQAR